MSRTRLSALPVFWQTLLLLVASVVIAQAMGLLVLFLSPPPRPDFNRLSDIAAALSGQPVERRRGHGDRDRRADRNDRDDRSDRDDRDRMLKVVHAPAAPASPQDMISDAGFVHMLAQRLGRPAGDVRLFFESERRRQPFFPGPRRPFSMRNGEPLFFTAIVAGMREGQGWAIARTPEPALVGAWQRRILLWFALSALVLAPLAWIFARAMTRPIRRFADAADRLGTDPGAPAIAEEGPSELRVTARALNRMQARLADYVGERTAMIGAIAHDLRTPLARIAFRIEAAPEPVREKVLGDVEQMRAMLAATIGFVRSTDASVARVEVDLAALLAAMVEQDRDLGRDVALDQGGGDGPVPMPVPVLGDPLALERLLQNLIDNGIAYGGAVTATARAGGGHALVTIADRGPGMPAELLARAFQPFVRGDPSRNRATGGIGLGLTIARTIAESHGGTLTLANRDGGGLEALLRLPLAD